MRDAVTGSAENLKSLKSPVRVIARSGVKLTTVSQSAVQNLIELQSEVVTSALTDVALRLERATRAASIVDLVRDQIELTPGDACAHGRRRQPRRRDLQDAGREFRGVAHSCLRQHRRKEGQGAADEATKRSVARPLKLPRLLRRKRAARKAPVARPQGGREYAIDEQDEDHT